MIFYHFLSLSRVRCHRTFSWWALVNACMRYGSSCNSANTGVESVFFGHSLVPWSAMRKTKEFREINASYFERISQPLQSNPVLLAVFDNTQIGIQQKYQQEGASSLFLKMTAKMFVKVQNHWADADTRGDPFDHVRCRRRFRIKREICTLQLELNNYLSDKDGM